MPGGVETRYSCCQGVMGAPGCQVFKVKRGRKSPELKEFLSNISYVPVPLCFVNQLHVHDALSLDGFVSTISRGPSDRSCPGVYSLDCEMVVLDLGIYMWLY